MRLPAGEVAWLAPVAPSKIIAVHLTYRSRLVEYNVSRMPSEPSYFMKPPSTLNGHLGELRRPRGARFLNYEGELAVVVGARMKGVGPDDVLDYVYGFAPANDVGLHDFRHADRGSMLRVKGQDGFLPIGPAVVTADEWTRPDDGYTLRTYLNGEVVQEADQDDLIWGYRYQLADLCRDDHAGARRRRSSPARRPTAGRCSRATSWPSRSTASAGSRTPSSTGTST